MCLINSIMRTSTKVKAQLNILGLFLVLLLTSCSSHQVDSCTLDGRIINVCTVEPIGVSSISFSFTFTTNDDENFVFNKTIYPPYPRKTDGDNPRCWYFSAYDIIKHRRFQDEEDVENSEKVQEGNIKEIVVRIHDGEDVVSEKTFTY